MNKIVTAGSTLLEPKTLPNTSWPTTAIKILQTWQYPSKLMLKLATGLPSQLWPYSGSKLPISLTRGKFYRVLFNIVLHENVELDWLSQGQPARSELQKERFC